MRLYSYNQLKELYGKDDKQVKLIDNHIKLIGECSTNRELEAFRRIEK